MLEQASDPASAHGWQRSPCLGQCDAGSAALITRAGDAGERFVLAPAATAEAIIEAAKTALKDAKDVKSARTAELTALGKVSFDGVTGKVAFDEFGDTTSKVLTVYKVDGGKWIAAKTDTFK